jgi:hypothetical protein
LFADSVVFHLGQIALGIDILHNTPQLIVNINDRQGFRTGRSLS